YQVAPCVATTDSVGLVKTGNNRSRATGSSGLGLQFVIQDY
ncbi:uncharacterized protein METZ01_LOCUS348168, partial [marine metagenome]